MIIEIANIIKLNREKIISRLKSKTKIVDNHWLWYGKLRHERGVITIGGKYGKDIEVHRLSACIYLNLNIEDCNSHALHKNTCSYKNCWNPECLYVGSHDDNMKDYKQSNKICLNGHSSVWWTIRRDGNRYCRACRKIREKEKRTRTKQ